MNDRSLDYQKRIKIKNRLDPESKRGAGNGTGMVEIQMTAKSTGRYVLFSVMCTPDNDFDSSNKFSAVTLDYAVNPLAAWMPVFDTTVWS